MGLEFIPLETGEKKIAKSPFSVSFFSLSLSLFEGPCEPLAHAAQATKECEAGKVQQAILSMN